jgi:predicted RNA-binding Zn-ribbon protein involved in translation (DUF1610 family)
MNTQEKFDAAARQVAESLQGKRTEFDCPYCGEKRPVTERAVCCLNMARTMNELFRREEEYKAGIAKLQLIENHIAAHERTGNSTEFTCPYCLKATMIGDGVPFCCKLFFEASKAIVERRRMEENTEQALRIMEAVYKKPQSRNLVSLN